jgi:hypothetical protein|tara:strand:- start:776 stop:886 length:111 start_codon:yes stop_codon:yes gene_type:complete
MILEMLIIRNQTKWLALNPVSAVLDIVGKKALSGIL